MRAYQFTQVGEGQDLYRCSVVNPEEVEAARNAARAAVRRAVFSGGNTAWGAEMVRQYPWLAEDTEITRYLTECCR